MNLKRKLLVGLAAAIIALTAIAGIAYAASNTSPNVPAPGFFRWCQMAYYNTMGSLSNTLGLKPEQIIEERYKGKSLADIAKEKGVPEDKVVQSILDERKKILDDQVRAGIITEDQEKLMLERMRAGITASVQSPGAGPARGTGCWGPGYWSQGYANPRTTDTTPTPNGGYSRPAPGWGGCWGGPGRWGY